MMTMVKRNKFREKGKEPEGRLLRGFKVTAGVARSGLDAQEQPLLLHMNALATDHGLQEKLPAAAG